MSELPLNAETKVTWSHPKEISTLLSLSRQIIAEKTLCRGKTSLPRASALQGWHSNGRHPDPRSYQHLLAQMASDGPPSANHISNTYSKQKSCTGLRCPRRCDKDCSHEPLPGLLCTGSFLSHLDQSIWGQRLRNADPCTATKQCRRTLQKSMALLLTPLYLSWKT